MRREAIQGSHLLYFSLALTLSASASSPVLLLSRKTGRVLEPRGHPPAPGAILHIETQEIVEHRLSERQAESENGSSQCIARCYLTRIFKMGEGLHLGLEAVRRAWLTDLSDNSSMSKAQN